MSTTPCSITIVSLPSAKLRDKLGYADYLGALQSFRAGSDDAPALLQMSAFLLDYPFSERLHPRALAAIEHLRTMGTAVILSDGDIVFQPRKIQRSGLWDAVEGRVLVTVHKERMRIDSPPDLGITRVGELIDFDLSHFHISRGAP